MRFNSQFDSLVKHSLKIAWCSAQFNNVWVHDFHSNQRPQQFSGAKIGESTGIFIFFKLNVIIFTGSSIFVQGISNTNYLISSTSNSSANFEILDIYKNKTIFSFGPTSARNPTEVFS